MPALHLTPDQAERFRRSDLNMEELVRTLHHLDECQQCRILCLSAAGEDEATRIVQADLILSNWEGGVHLPDEQIIAFAEETLDNEAQRMVASHLAQCGLCRTQVERIRALHRLLIERQDMAVAPLSEIMVKDSSGSIILDRDRIRRENARKLPAEIAGWIRRLLTDGVIAPSRSLAAALLLTRDAALPLPVRRNATHSLISPVNTVIRSSNLELRWQDVPGAGAYSVVVMQVARRNCRLVWKGHAGMNTTTSLPSDVALAAGQLYLWQITTGIHGIETNSAIAWFSILSAEATAQVAEIERQYGDSAMILLGAYEKYGLYADAQRQIDRLMELNPDSAQVHNLAQRLEQQRSILSSASAD